MLDEAEDTLNAAVEVNRKLEIPAVRKKYKEGVEEKTISYEKIFEYLKTDERN